MAWTTPSTFVAGATLTAATLNAQIRDNFNAAFPVGSLHYFIQNATSAETTVNGFALECNAVSVLRATYSSLNTLLSGLSYPFGSVDGTHMTLPDLRARAPHGMASGGHTDMDALGDSDGQAVATRTTKHNSTNSVTVSATAIAAALTATSIQPNGGAFVHDGSGSLLGAGAQSGQTVALVGSGSVSTSGTIGPGGTLLTDKTPWLVAGIYAVKY